MMKQKEEKEKEKEKGEQPKMKESNDESSKVTCETDPPKKDLSTSPILPFTHNDLP